MESQVDHELGGPLTLGKKWTRVPNITAICRFESAGTSDGSAWILSENASPSSIAASAGLGWYNMARSL